MNVLIDDFITDLTRSEWIKYNYFFLLKKACNCNLTHRNVYTESTYTVKFIHYRIVLSLSYFCNHSYNLPLLLNTFGKLYTLGKKNYSFRKTDIF